MISKWKKYYPLFEKDLLKLKKYKSNGIGRLQNIPRHGLTKKNMLNESMETIVQSFPTADMSMKIA